MGTRITISTKDKLSRSMDYKIISARMKAELLEQLDSISAQTNRSRNEVINLLLESSLDILTIE